MARSAIRQKDAPAPASRKRAERLEARITPEQKSLIERAAALQGRSVTDFVVSTVQDAAKRTIEEYQIIRLSVRDAAVFAEAILNPPEPGPRLRAAVARYKRMIGG